MIANSKLLSGLLYKFSSSPGKCSEGELVQLKKFLISYKEHQVFYQKAMNREPQGEELTVAIDKVDYYRRRIALATITNKN